MDGDDMTSWAALGVKCVCIHDAWQVRSGLVRAGGLPRVDCVYAITDTAIGPDGEMYLQLAEFDVFKWFWVERFRPLVTRTQDQDVELFRSLLTDLPVGVDA
jgi:hypothetical protein